MGIRDLFTNDPELAPESTTKPKRSTAPRPARSASTEPPPAAPVAQTPKRGDGTPAPIKPITGAQTRQAIVGNDRGRAISLAERYAALEEQIATLSAQRGEIARTLLPLLKATTAGTNSLPVFDGTKFVVIKQSRGSKRPTRAGILEACGQAGADYWASLKPTPGPERLVIQESPLEAGADFAEDGAEA